MSDAKLYRVREFAARVGVTVRALHHYDRLGLLKPSGRTEAGYRLYRQRDFGRLEQIVALKFVGFSLKQIRGLMEPKPGNLLKALRLQRRLMEQKRRYLDQALKAIERAERALASPAGGEGVDALQRIIEVINMQQDTSWMMKYYSEEAQRAIRERQKLWTPELQAEATQDWAAMAKAVEDAIARGVDPASPEGAALAGRWQKLVEGFTGGNPALTEGLKKLHADRKNWPSTVTWQMPYGKEVEDFICKAFAARQRT